MDPRTTRGFFNNNPGNMDRSTGEPWQGEIRDTTDARLTEFQRSELLHGRFCVFVSAQWGIRAMVRNLQAYQRSGWGTINTQIDHWAPPNENNTTAYKARVSASTGKGLNESLDMTNYNDVYAEVDAIIRVECGGMPYTPKEIEDGLRLANLVKPVTLASSVTAKGAAVATTSTIASVGITTLQQPIQQLADTMEPLSGTSQTFAHIFMGLKVALGIIALVGVGIMLWQRYGRAQRDGAIDHNPTPDGV